MHFFALAAIALAATVTAEFDGLTPDNFYDVVGNDKARGKKARRA